MMWRLGILLFCLFGLQLWVLLIECLDCRVFAGPSVNHLRDWCATTWQSWQFIQRWRWLSGFDQLCNFALATSCLSGAGNLLQCSMEKEESRVSTSVMCTLEILFLQLAGWDGNIPNIFKNFEECLCLSAWIGVSLYINIRDVDVRRHGTLGSPCSDGSDIVWTTTSAKTVRLWMHLTCSGDVKDWFRFQSWKWSLRQAPIGQC